MKRKGEFLHDQKRLGARIKALRKDAGLNQTQLAERVGVKIMRISGIENGLSTTTDTLHRIANALGYQVELVKKE